MKLYLYCEKNRVFNYLSRNFIACENILQDIEEKNTLNAYFKDYLLVTHKKLSIEDRHFGINDKYNSPIILEFETTNNFKCIIINKTDNIEYSFDYVENINKNSEFCLLLSNIPWSQVKNIYFEDKDQMDDFYRGEPDLWFPESKYTIVDDSFNEKFNLDIKDVNVIKINDILKENNLDIFLLNNNIAKIEKINAEKLLSFKHYQDYNNSENYIFNDKLLKDFKISLNKKSKKNIIIDTKNYLCVNNDKYKEENTKIYTYLINKFYNSNKIENYTDFFNNLLIDEIVKSNIFIDNLDLQSKYISLIHKIFSFCNKTSKEDFKTLFYTNDFNDFYILRSLFYVVKNPNDFISFNNSFFHYETNNKTKRTAYELWGALNGASKIPGKGFYKNDEVIWNLIESIHNDHSEFNINTLKVIPENIETVNLIPLYKIYTEYVLSKKLPKSLIKLIVDYSYENDCNKLYDHFILELDNFVTNAKNKKGSYFNKLKACNSDLKIIIDILKKLPKKLKDEEVYNYILNQDYFYEIYNTIYDFKENIEKIKGI